jgi:hypothetical protein
MPMLVVRIGRMRMRVRSFLVTMRMAVLAVDGRVVLMIMVTVVMAVRMLVLDGSVHVQMSVRLGQV